MACGTEDRVDGVAFGACEVVSFQETVVLEVADDRFDGRAPAVAFSLLSAVIRTQFLLILPGITTSVPATFLRPR